VPKEREQVVLRCLEKNRDARFASAIDFAGRSFECEVDDPRWSVELEEVVRSPNQNSFRNAG